MHIESTRLIHNNIHNTQMVIHNLINIHKLINIHESTLFEILPGGNTEYVSIVGGLANILFPTVMCRAAPLI